ncbi:hypothetical protein FACS1894127_6770 [Clostridia bacterium]|nr:hypothetical protein FACS1894127_6770 [Clostridia bacterium]
MTTITFAETEGQKRVKESNISIKWIEYEVEYKDVNIGHFCDGTGLRTIQITMNDLSTKHGLIDENGVLVIPAVYDAIGTFSEGLRYIQSGNKKTYVDSSWKEILDVSQYDESNAFYGRFAVVSKNQKFGLIDKTGNEILPCQYDEVFNNKNGLIWARKEDVYGFFDNFGREILGGMVFSEIESYNFKELLRSAKKAGEFGIISENGVEVLPFTYENMMVCDNDIVAIYENGKWGYMNVGGNQITSFQFEIPGRFSEGLAPVLMNGKYGYINRLGEIVVSCKYLHASNFYNGVAIVTEIVDGKYCNRLIDKTGIIIESKEYGVTARGDALIGQYNLNHYETASLAPRVMKEALLDNGGDRLTGFFYTDISEFKEDFAVASTYEVPQLRYGLLNRYGSEIVPFLFDDIEIINSESCFVKVSDIDYKNGKIGILRIPTDSVTGKLPIEKQPITVHLDGVELYFDTEPTIDNGRTMVPMRKIFETLGANVTWDGQTKTVKAVKSNVTVEIGIGKGEAFVNGKTIFLDVPAMIKNGRTLIPLRFISEALGCNVRWKADKRDVIIFTSLSRSTLKQNEESL